MIDLDKYKTQPHEIESDILLALPMKDLLELIKCCHSSSVEIMNQMMIHKSNVSKIQDIMNVGLGKE